MANVETRTTQVPSPPNCTKSVGDMPAYLRSRTGVFPGVTTEPVDVLDVIADGVVIGSFYRLDTQGWVFLGPWAGEHPVRENSTEDCIKRSDRTFWLYTDGASRTNPKRAAIGAVLYDPGGGEVATLSRTIGPATNNTAEYRAFIEGLEMALCHDICCLVVRTDSLLVVRQVTGDFKVKAPALKPLHAKAVGLVKRFPRIHVEHVPRKYNQKADKLADAAFGNTL